MGNSKTTAEKGNPPFRGTLFPSRLAVQILIADGIILLFCFGVILSGASQPHPIFWDNFHWTSSYLAAAWLTWIGYQSASPADRMPRRWLAWGMTANALGQIFWNLQILWGQPPVPNIADAAFILVGPFFITAFLASMRGHAEAKQMKWVALDAAALSVAVISITLALYLPHIGHASALALAMLTAYPVTFLSAACVGIIVALTLKAAWNSRWIFFLVALLIYGATWMQWNSLALKDALENGSLLNMLFSIVVLALGFGAMIWHVGDAPSHRWGRLCEGVLRILPIFLVIVSVTSVALVRAKGKAPESVQYAIILGALLVIILAMIRQSLLLSERSRMLAAEQRSKESEQKYRLLFETAQDGIFFMENGLFQDCNESILRLFSCTREEILGHSPEEFSPDFQPDGRLSSEKAVEKISQALAGKPQTFEWRHCRFGGVEFDAEVSLNRIELMGRTMLLAVVRDLSERKQVQEALHMSEQKFSNAFEHAPIGKALVAPDGQWLKVNRALRQILGYPWEELVKLTFQEITHPDDLDADLLKVKQMLAGEIETYQMEKRYFHKDGHVVPVLLSVSLVRDSKGQPLFFISQIEDITQRKLLEEQFRQAQKMEALGTLAGGIAHDFNNILAAINGYSELARMEARDHPGAIKYMDSVIQAGERAADLVRQILAFSRQQNSKRVPLRLSEVVDDAMKLLRATIPSTIEFKIALNPGLPPVLADATQVHQLVMNLGTNAWHAMRDQPGQLEVTLDEWEVDRLMSEGQIQLPPASYARLSVRDNGKGMDEATVSRIFEPFFTTKAPGAGTGLGLSVVHGIMQSHEGAVHVYSQPGEGSVFHLYFPVYRDELIPTENHSAPVSRGNGENILFLDDEPALAELGKKFLELLGYRVKSFSNVIAALEELSARPDLYDLVITDQSMPKMSGIEFARQVRTIREDLPIILSTGYASSLTFEEVKKIGIRDLLLKPLCLRSLGAAVEQIFKKK